VKGKDEGGRMKDARTKGGKQETESRRPKTRKDGSEREPLTEKLGGSRLLV
jgi:hypothetical protein